MLDTHPFCYYEDHQYCVVAEVVSLMDHGFRCYLEYDIPINDKQKVVVDIYAKRERIELLIEVGSLSPSHVSCREERLHLLRKLMPNANVIHITQWKNYINTLELEREKNDYWWQLWRWRTYRKWGNETIDSHSSVTQEYATLHPEYDGDVIE